MSASWRLIHNALDLELGRAYYITKALSLRPHWGLRGGWLNQKFKSSCSISHDVETVEVDFHAKNNFWGVGPRVGIHGQWHIANSSWSILGKASTSLLLGKTTMHFYVEDTNTSRETPTELDRDVRDRFSQLVPNLQIFLGLDWGSCLDCDHYYLGINAGWETNIYWNQFNIPVSNANPEIIPVGEGIGNQAVTMEGLTVNLHLDF